MDVPAFNTARTTLYAVLLDIYYNGEQPGHVEKLGRALEILDREAKADPAWAARVEKLTRSISTLPICSTDPRKRLMQLGYLTVIQTLESWGHPIPSQ